MLTILIIAAALAGQPEDTPLLSGPEVSETKMQSLVHRGMTGGFVRIEGRPEFAAARVLDLDADALERVRDIEADRGVSLVVMLIDRIDDLRDMTDATTAGDAQAARAIMRSMWEDHDTKEPVLPSLKALGDALLPEQLAETQRLADEYMHAWAEEQRTEGETVEQAKQRLAFQLFQEEVRYAYDASLTTTRQALEGIYNAVNPTPEQREEIRTIVIDHIKHTRLKATPEQRREAMRRIYDMLDEDRKGKLFDYTMQIVVPG
jgi:tRNA-dihydrouridine synthase